MTRIQARLNRAKKLLLASGFALQPSGEFTLPVARLVIHVQPPDMASSWGRGSWFVKIQDLEDFSENAVTFRAMSGVTTFHHDAEPRRVMEVIFSCVVWRANVAGCRRIREQARNLAEPLVKALHSL